MILVSRDKRQILGYDIAFDRSRERIQKLVDKSVFKVAYISHVEDIGWQNWRYDGERTIYQFSITRIGIRR